jgi:hypothetical protein
MKFVSSVFLSAGLLVVSPAVNTAFAGQPEGTEKAMPQKEMTQQKTPEVSDKELKKFVDAQKSLRSIQAEHKSALSGVQNPDKAKQIQQKFQQKMLNAVNSAGLEPQRYKEIGQAVNGSQSLQKRFIAIMNNQ